MNLRKMIAFACAVSFIGSGNFAEYSVCFAGVSDLSAGKEYTSGDYVYSYYDSDSVKLIRYTGDETDIVFPAEIDGYKVEAIEYTLFRDNENSGNVKTVTVPSGIECISDGASAYKGVFYDMSSLESVRFEGDITSLGMGAFSKCVSLKEVNMDKVTSELVIPENCFMSCSSLESVNLPESVVKIEKNAFANDILLSEINLPDGLKSIGANSFMKTNLSEINIPGSVKEIYAAAFRDCPSLKRVTMEEGVNKLYPTVFNDCTELSEVSIPSTLTQIYSSAFSGTKWQNDILKNNHYVIANGLLVTSDIGGDIVIPEGVTVINDNAFLFNKELTSVIIPEGVTKLGHSAFSQCPNLKSIKCPESLVTIDPSVFADDYLLESLEIPRAKSIGGSAFSKCKSLKEIKFPDNLNKIDKYTLYSCESLKKVIIPASVKEVAETFILDCKDVDVYFYNEKTYMNPKCIPADCVKTIYGYAGSTAEKYASANNIPFRLIGEEETPEPVDTIAGDSDGNGTLNMQDVVGLIEYLIADGESINKKNADINKDGLVNVLDLIALKQIILS